MAHNPCTFDELKARSGPPLNAWGLYPEGNELGRVNLITPAAVKRGRDAIKHGIAVNLNASLSTFPSMNPAARPPAEHEIIFRGHCLDDKITFNTQCATQWDGFRHFPYKNYPTEGTHTYHGGMTEAEAKDPENKAYGVHLFADHPLTSRAHLLDVPRYLARNNLPPLSAFDRSTPISLATLQACAKEEGAVFAPGDILVVRTGFTEAVYAQSAEEHAAMLKRGNGWVGVEQSEEFMRWTWEQGIAAVATDAFAFEVYPPVHPLSCHEVFLAGWGLPIGELFDLRKLATECERLGQWTFMLASVAVNMEGGIASPGNAQAIL